LKIVCFVFAFNTWPENWAVVYQVSFYSLFLMEVPRLLSSSQVQGHVLSWRDWGKSK